MTDHLVEIMLEEMGFVKDPYKQGNEVWMLVGGDGEDSVYVSVTEEKDGSFKVDVSSRDGSFSCKTSRVDILRMREDQEARK